MKQASIAADQLTAPLTLTAAEDAPGWVGRLALQAETRVDGQDRSFPGLAATQEDGKPPSFGYATASPLRSSTRPIRRNRSRSRKKTPHRSFPELIDRLVHHCVILELNVPSYRAEQAKKGRQEPGPAE